MKRWFCISLLLAFFLASLASSPASKASLEPQGREVGNFFRGAERAAIEGEFERLKQVQSRLEFSMVSQPGVMGFGIGVNTDTRQLVYRVFVDEDEPMPFMPETIEGVPVEVERRKRLVALNGGDGCIPCHSEQFSLPVQMGNSMQSADRCSACTLGFKARDLDTGQLVYVTAAHCTTDATGCSATGPPGQSYFHRGPLDNGCSLLGLLNIGTLADQAFPTLGDNLDATVIASNDMQTSSAIRDIGTPSTIPGTVLPGDAVQKSGRTTGHTFGIVIVVNFAGVVAYTCGNELLTGLIGVNAAGGCANPPCAFARPGDSGSSLLNMANPPRIAGLLIGATSDGLFAVANPVADILNRFNLALDTSFDICLQDDSDPSKVALVSSTTGSYRFSCNGEVFTGMGNVNIRGKLLTLSAPDRRVLIKVDQSVHRGTATMQTSQRCTIIDRNTADSMCNLQ